MVRCEPDIVRFCDPDATDNRFRIHTVELSDERSTTQFVTLWFKGQESELPGIEAWKRERGLRNHHQREVYHRGPAWLPTQYPGKQKRGWSHHCHVDLNRPPQWNDLEPFVDEIPPALQDDLRLYLSQQNED